MAILKNSVILDYGGMMMNWKDLAMDYRDLSAGGNSAEAAQSVFETLRWAELVPEARLILFPHLNPPLSDALALAVKDRLTRAASGKVIHQLDESSSLI
mmetsp:Transcript_10990/g.22523  ORF Transcript_10990/g.22523 Transcript_10990/m.22523 type:complete len:99 (-) Transcript_10990:36-332(-)